MKLRIFTLLMILMSTHRGLAQFNSPNPSAPAASTAAAMESIKMSNDLYNGKINISIPLLNYEFEGISFPVILNYTSGNGIFADQTPGWAGLGWNLSAGGFIHRTVRGKPDETRDFETVVHKFYINGFDYYEKQTTLNSTDYSYFSNFSKLQNSSTWSTQANANTLQPSQSNYSYSVSDGSNGTKTFYNHHPMYDLAPDEFTFSFGSFSGKFYYDHFGGWLVESNDGHSYTVAVFTGEMYINSSQWVPKIIKYFTLTTESGIKLYFGNSNISDPYSNQYIDHSHSSSVKPLNPQEANPIFGADYVDIVPHTWHLTKVENVKTGSVVTLNYKLSGWTFYKSLQAWGNSGGVIYTNNQVYLSDPDNWNSMYRLSAISKVATRAWTLTSIDFPDNVSMVFSSEASTQLTTNETLGITDNAGFYQYEDMISVNNEYNTLLKLTNIDLKYGVQNVKGVSFSYSGGQNDRLKLSSISIGKGAGVYNQYYSFTYNETSLPAYASGKTDSWGFYNNKNFFTSIAGPYNDYAKLSTYASYRTPDYNYAKAEMLTGITLPTGGAMSFEYEPNDYARKINNDFTISTVSNTQGGGVRIKKVIQKSSATDVAFEKSYEYTEPESAVSSGILASREQLYLLGTSGNFSFNASGYSPSFYDGSAVTYSYVKEKETGNGLILYNFTNYSDAGFNNEPPVSTNTGPVTAFPYAYRNNSFKRGKLRFQKFFSEAGNALREQYFYYEHDNPENTKPELRSLFYKEQGSNAYYYASVSERIYNDYLLKTVVYDNTTSGTVTSQSKNTYDQYGNVKESSHLTSNGQEIATLYKYAHEYTEVGNDFASIGILNLKNAGIKNAIVEKLTVRRDPNGNNPVVIGGTLYQYSTQSLFVNYEYTLEINNPIQLPLFVQSAISGGSFTKDVRYGLTPETKFSNYDSHGNILEQQRGNNIKQSFEWGYNSLYPITAVKNASNSAPVYTTQTTSFTHNVPESSPNSGFNFTSAGGTIKIRLNISPEYTYGMQYNLTGPSNGLGSLCASGSSTTCTLPQEVTFTDMPAGNYSLSLTQSDGSVYIPRSVFCQYDAQVISTPAIKNFFHTSFEEGEGNSADGDSKTGKKSKTGGYSKSLSGLTSGQYILSYWQKSGSIWTYVESKVPVTGTTSNISIPNNIQVDEIRFYPDKAQMTTYTYEPLIGMTSQCDANNNITYYEYDDFGRLSLVKDQDKNILKRYCYNYQGQTEACSVSNHAPQFITSSQQIIVKEKETKVITLSTEDEDGDYLNWTFSGLPNFISVQIHANGNSCTLTINPNWGDYADYNIQPKVDDDKGGSDAIQLLLTVLQMPVTGPTDDGTAPHKPAYITATYVNNSVLLNWENRAYNAEVIDIYRSNYLSGPFDLLTPNGTGSPNDTSYADTTIETGKTYYYFLRVRNQYGYTTSTTLKIIIP